MHVEHIIKKANAGLSDKIPCTLQYRIIKIDLDQQLVMGVVYSPWILDSHGHYMSDTEVEKTAHAFLMAGRQNQVDVMHDNRVINAMVVESYVDRIGSADIPAGSWVATTKVHDKQVWDRIKNGELNGYSMEIMSYMVKHKAEITFDAWVLGETQPDPFDGHTHIYLVKMDDKGNLERGFTSKNGPDNHRHTISRLSVTDPYNNTTHRFIV